MPETLTPESLVGELQVVLAPRGRLFAFDRETPPRELAQRICSTIAAWGHDHPAEFARWQQSWRDEAPDDRARSNVMMSNELPPALVDDLAHFLAPEGEYSLSGGEGYSGAGYPAGVARRVLERIAEWGLENPGDFTAWRESWNGALDP